MKINGMKFQTSDNSTGRTTDNTGVYLKGDARQAQNAHQVYYMPYPDNELNDCPRANWMVVVKCKPRGRIETQEVLVADEAYQNAKDIPVKIVTDTGTPETLRSVTGELDIVNTQVPNNENQIDSEVEECNSEDNESASADSISTQEFE
ncbi:hypothetical protein PIB30_074400 [Stylosanthes scabra]|uniref:DUF3892 domain-containing protein n=1 Tax=Stylosanthes scabra TaxID=79078 RepID=A0ABU6QQB8_9FABA|nr:hypothetical protein [Stylosanthes scabra]